LILLFPSQKFIANIIGIINLTNTTVYNEQIQLPYIIIFKFYAILRKKQERTEKQNEDFNSIMFLKFLAPQFFHHTVKEMMASEHGVKCCLQILVWCGNLGHP
jgi:hypothetical protein